ncbi:MAG: DNA recombination protein RmuC [Methylococcales bacterium]
MIIQFFQTNSHLIIAGIFGFILALLVMLWRYRGHNPQDCRSLSTQQHEHINDLNTTLNKVQRDYQHASTQMAVMDERIATLLQFEQSVADYQQQLKQESTERIQAQQKALYLADVESQFQKQQNDVNELKDQLTKLKTNEAELTTLLHQEKKRSEEKLELVRQSEAQLSQRFENLANKILDDNTKKFTQQNQVNLQGLLTPLREQLGEFKTKVEDIHLHDSKDRATLREELSSLRQQTQKINEEAINLTKALKGDKKVQGNWGEMVLERVLEQSGLRQGKEYDIQRGYRDEQNRLYKPDVIVRLPENKDVVIDSKVSLLAYDAYSSTENEDQQAVALKQHIDSVRKHIQELSAKDYSSLKGLRSLDFVLLFMPIEAAFMVAFQYDEKLFSDAFEHKIIVVTPTTLLATLRTIENIWRYERQNENARIIADKAGSMHDKLCGFVQDMEKIGLQIDTLHRTYEGAMGKLSTGKGNLIRQANSLVELGAKTRKSLPRTLLTNADDEVPKNDVDTNLSE